MPNTQSAKKDLQRNEVRRERNRGRKSAMRSAIKNTLSAIEAGNVEAAEKHLVTAQKLIDKNAKWNQIHANKAARQKSQLARAVNGLKQG